MALLEKATLQENTNDHPTIKLSWLKPQLFKLEANSIFGFPGFGSDIGSVPNETPS